jgi:hypothetical protein
LALGFLALGGFDGGASAGFEPFHAPMPPLTQLPFTHAHLCFTSS